MFLPQRFLFSASLRVLCCSYNGVSCSVFIFPFLLPIHLLFLAHMVFIPCSLFSSFSSCLFSFLYYLLSSSSPSFPLVICHPFLLPLISSHVSRLCLMFYSSATLEFPLSIFVTLPLLCCLVSSLFVSDFCLIHPLFLFLWYIASCSHSPLPFPSFPLICLPSRHATLNHKR